MCGSELLRVAGFCFGGDVDRGGGGCGCVERGEDAADFSVAHGADDYEVVAFCGRGLPDVAGGEGDLRDATFGLPASGNGAREFSVVRDDQDAGVRQEISPKQSQRRRPRHKEPARRRRYEKQRQLESQRRPAKAGRYEVNSLSSSRLQFFGFLYEREEALGTDAEIYRGFGVLGALGLLDAALEIGNFGLR